MNLKKHLYTVAHSEAFTIVITILIIINCILISVELDRPSPTVHLTQKVILYLFLMEIFIRWFGRSSNQEYLGNGWNYFDILLVSLSFIPESLLSNPELVTSLRILRVFRVFRLIKAFPELQIITKVLLRSIASLSSVCLLMLIVMYVYSIIAVILFRGQSEVITGVGAVGDPFGSVLEAMFSMFRVLTGEDWTDLRYDLLVNNDPSNHFLITIFFVSFYILAAFLLINLVVGAVCNNYDSVMQDHTSEDVLEPSSHDQDILTQITEIKKQLERIDRKIDS